MRRLAVGGMAEVYLATLAGPRGFEKKVVVKQILPQLAREPELLQLFFDEAAIAQCLAHPGIVQVFDVGQHDGTHYIAMEFVDGLDLDDLVRRQFRAAGRGLPVALAVRVVLDLARAVHYAHEATDASGRALDVIHRDISPQNVMLGRDGAVKLGDFGIARTNLRARHTQTGVLRGKISYLAPERFAGERASRGVDVYAMGVVLFETIAGKRPYVGDDAALIKQILHDSPPRLADRFPDVDPRIDALIAAAMARNLDERLPTARALAEGLLALGSAAALAELGAYVSRMADRGPTAEETAARASAPRPRSTETLPGRLDDPDASLVAEAVLRAETQLAPPAEPSESRAVVRAATIGVGEAIVPLAGPEPSAVPLASPSAEATRAMPLVEAEATRIQRPPEAPRGRTASVLVAVARRRPLGAVAAVCAVGLLAGWIITQLWLSPEPAAPAARPTRVVEAVLVPTHRPAAELTAGTHLVLPEGDAPPLDAVRVPTGPGPRAASPAEQPEAVADAAVHDAPGHDGHDAPAESPAAAAPEPAADTPRRVPSRRSRRTARSRSVGAVTPAASAAATGGEGELSIDAEPWAYVIVDGRSLGPTPLAHVRLPAGTHRVRLENPEQGLARNIPVVIREDQRTALRIRLSDGQTLRP